MEDQHAYLSASAIARLMRESRTSSTEITRLMLDRISRANPRLNAFVTLSPESALAQAAGRDSEARAGKVLGPLHGVPISIKDNLATAGIRSTAGLVALKDSSPERDSPVVERLRQAGAVILGKTNLPPMALDLQTRNPLFGVTNNPWDLSRSPGGSSGGEAAAVAAGLSYLGVGNDLLASVRQPAHYCGLFSLIPGTGRIPNRGLLPSDPPGTLLKRFLRMGFLARSLEDLALAFTACAGPHPADPFNREAGNSIRHDASSIRLRIAWTTHMGRIPLDRASHALISGFVAALATQRGESSCVVSELPEHPLENIRVAKVFMGAMSAGMGLVMPPFLRFIARMGDPAIGMDLRGYQGLEEECFELSSQMDAFFNDWDLLITPTASTPAIRHIVPSAWRGPTPVYKSGVPVDGELYDYGMATAGFCVPYAVTGNPVITVPIGLTGEGLPVCVQVVGRRGQDERLLDMAKMLVDESRRFKKPRSIEQSAPA